MANALYQKKIIVGVGGGIAAYRSLELIRLLKKAGANVVVMATPNALQFVGALSFEALSGRPCLSDGLSMSQGQITHIEEAALADAIVIAPATCDLIAKMAHGIADALLLQTLLSFRGPVVVAPAMESMMWEHEATQANAKLLLQQGCRFVGPASGALASGRNGIGRMAEPSAIVDELRAMLSPQDFAGRTVLVTAGPTLEDLDPVRFISNRSSGRMGVALARALAERGAKVRFVHGPLQVPVPQLEGIDAVSVRSADQMREAVMARVGGCDMAVMAAAVADFTPVHVYDHKQKKGKVPKVELKATVDILKTVGALPAAQKPFLVGFAAESENLEAEATRKCIEKNCDLICANLIVGAHSAFDAEDNELIVIDRDRRRTHIGPASKDEIAHALLDIVASMQ